MEHKKQLIDMTEKFYIDVVEEFKESELQIIADSKFSNLFKKKDYDGNLARLRACKKTALCIDVREISFPAGDEESKEVARRLEKCLVVFNNLCDSYIQLQLALKKKANKESLKFSEYKEIFQKVQTARNTLNSALHDLDIVYTEYAFEDEEE
ncbi:MAG: hypothetical protein Q4C46_01690 [Bacillota bacterium]|nr:hypothetical protein [Bacillota bacterium]